MSGAVALECINCKSSEVTKVLKDPHLWCTASLCNKCHFRWFNCSTCGTKRCFKGKTIFQNKRELSQHHFHYHMEENICQKKRNKRVLNEMSHHEFDSHCKEESMIKVIASSDSNKKKIKEEEACFASISNEKYREYFSNEHNRKGGEYLVSKAHFGSCHYGSINKKEISLHLRLTSLVMKVKRNERVELMNALRQVIEVTKENAVQDYVNSRKGILEEIKSDKDSVSNICVRTRIPSSDAECRKLYLDGKASIKENLPIPRITLLSDDKHAYVSLFEIITDAFGHGINILNLRDKLIMGEKIGYPMKVRHIYESKRAKEICSMAPKDAFVFLLIEWKDDAKANRGMRNTGSIWLQTLSFVAKNQNMEYRSNTYPMAMGPKGVNHDIVQESFRRELQSLRDCTKTHMVYSATHKANIRVYGDLFVCLMDQPERRNSNGLMLGNGIYSSRWGYSVNIKSIYKNLPSCEKCLSLLKEKKISDSHCSACLNWKTDICHDKLRYEAPKNFPKNELGLTDHNTLMPFKLSYDILSRGVQLTHDKLEKGEWNQGQARAYLSVLCLNHETQEEIISHGLNAYALQKAKTKKHVNKTNYMQLMQMQEINPSVFVPWNIPAVWDRGVSLHNSIDVVMHLLFLGVEKTVNKEIRNLLKAYGKLSLYKKHVATVLDDLTNISVRDWCDIMVYGEGGFSNWISDNFLAMARIAPWFYSTIDIVKDSNKQGNLSQQMNDICHVVHEMISAKTQMIYRIMGDTMTADIIIEIEIYIKLFLSSYVRFENILSQKESRKFPSWVTASNFICLLNLPDLISNVGPLRNLWEGSMIGEKVLGGVKDEFTGFRKNWNTSLLKRIYGHIGMKKVMMNSESIKEEPISKYSRYGRFHKYKTLFEFRSFWERQGVISLVELKDGRLISVIQNNAVVEFTPLKRNAAITVNVNGLIYAKWKWAEHTYVLESNLINRYCLMLPCLSMDYNSSYYTVVSDDWQVINKNLEFTNKLTDE